MRAFRRLLVQLLGLVGLILAVLALPDPWFSYRLKSGRFEVLSDRPLELSEVSAVLADADRRIAGSALFSPDQTFRLFVCYGLVKFAVFSQRGPSNVGAVADGWLTRNIYFRPVDFRRNRMIPPGGWLADPTERPLSYFVAHEATHIMESRRFGRLYAIQHPVWLNEGYADYVGKGGQFDLRRDLARLRAGDEALDPGRSGLYRRYHLAVAYLLDYRRRTVEQVFSEDPSEASVLADLMKDPALAR